MGLVGRKAADDEVRLVAENGGQFRGVSDKCRAGEIGEDDVGAFDAEGFDPVLDDVDRRPGSVAGEPAFLVMPLIADLSWLSELSRNAPETTMRSSAESP